MPRRFRPPHRNRVGYCFGSEAGLCTAGVSVPSPHGRIRVSGSGTTRVEAVLDALAKLAPYVDIDLEVGADLVTGGGDLKTQTANNRRQYGAAIQEYGRAIRSGVELAHSLSLGGSSNEEILNGIAGGLATAGAILAAIPGVGWIASAVVEIAAAILAGVNWLLSSYPAYAMDPYQAGINYALRDLGYSTVGGGADVFKLDGNALMHASADGWIFFSRQKTTDETNESFVAAWPAMVATMVSHKIPVWNPGERPSPEMTEFMQLRRRCIEATKRGQSSSGTECTLYVDAADGARERFAAIFGPIGARGINYPPKNDTLSKEKGAILFHGEPAGGVPVVVAGFRLDALPPDVVEAIAWSFLAPKEDWPKDMLVNQVLQRVQPPESADQVTKDAAKQLLVYLGEAVKEANIAAAAPRQAQATFTPIANAAQDQPQQGQRQIAPGQRPWEAPPAPPSAPPTFDPIPLSDAIADKLVAVRDMAQLARKGDTRRVRDIIRRGGPIGRLARRLVEA